MAHVLQEPSKAIIEMQQCIAQAMSISVRKPQGKPADPTTLLLQLPYTDMETAKKLRRRKIQTLKGEPQPQGLGRDLDSLWSSCTCLKCACHLQT